MHGGGFHKKTFGCTVLRTIMCSAHAMKRADSDKELTSLLSLQKHLSSLDLRRSMIAGVCLT